MRRNIIFVLLLLFGLGSSSLFTTPLKGGKGLFYIHSADVLSKGHLEWYNGITYFGKIANFEGGVKPYTLWTVQGYTSINFGINSHIELGLSPIVYQDTNTGNLDFSDKVNIPDDLVISFKMGSYHKLESPFVFGGMLYTRIPTAKSHNIIYEPYSAGRLEIGISGLVSYYKNVTFPQENWSLHGNFSYLNHNDVGKELTINSDDETAESMTTELLLGLGWLYPAGSFDFSFEINFRYFLTRPPITAYSREHLSYLTAGVYYKLYRWMTIEMAFDIGIFSEEDYSVYSPETYLPPPPTEDFPNYPSWRGLIGVKFNVLPHLFSSSDDLLSKQRSRDRRAILEKLLEEQKDTEDAENELSKIRSDRRRVEEELERLRQLLEQEKKEKEKENEDK